jgi:glycosyltransferase involved in cell wall biosynthesis
MSGRTFAAVIPAHDGLPDVLDAVGSALSQSRGPAEVIVVDDRSQDGTGDAVERRFGAAVRVVRGHFGSAAAARNAGWRAATAEWVAFLDADDLWFPDKLATASAALDAAPAARWGFSDGTFRTLEGELRESWLEPLAEVPEDYVGQPVAELIEVNFVLTSSVVVARAALAETGGFDETLSHAEDVDLWIRLARRWPAAGCRRALVRYQHRPGGLTRQVESRLGGDVALYRRLSEDVGLAAPLRRAARRREALAQFKLALNDLRDGRPADARQRLPRAWMFPERAVPVLSLALSALLPPSWFARLRRRGWAKRGAGPMAALRRVTLRPGGTPGRAA